MYKYLWKKVQLSLSEKFNARESISVKLWKLERKQLKFLTILGSSASNRNIYQYSYIDSIIENVKAPALKAILKYKKTNTLAF